MAVIGHAAKVGNKIIGSIRTVTITASLELIPIDEKTERGPDYRVFVNGVEAGAAWEKISQQQRPYLSVSIDDPSFAAPINGSLVDSSQEPGTLRLLWDRPRQQPQQ